MANEHLMTGPNGNSEFCFPETLNDPRGKCFVIPPNSKIEKKKKNAKELFAWRQLSKKNLPQFQGVCLDHVRVESSSCCFPR